MATLVRLIPSAIGITLAIVAIQAIGGVLVAIGG